MYFGLIISVILCGLSLAMDAFAVSVCDGMVYRGLTKPKAVSIPLTFGFFQAFMPIIGFYVGLFCIEYIQAFDHWIALILLCVIGGKMIFDGIKEIRSDGTEVNAEKSSSASYSYPTVLVQGVATSIDALAVGFSLNAMLEGIEAVQLWAWISVSVIGVITFAISLAGLLIGIKFGKIFQKKASVATIIGGAVLVLIGVKIVVGSYVSLPF